MKYEITEVQYCTFPTPSTPKTREIYGKEISGKITTIIVFNVLKIKLTLIDLPSMLPHAL